MLKNYIPAEKINTAADEKKAEQQASESKGAEQKTDSVTAVVAEKQMSEGADKLLRGTIDLFLGLQYSAGDGEMYKEFLRMFCDMSKDKKEKIQVCYEQENWEDYTVLVHALKSTSLSVGAKKLSENALELERAGKEKRISYIFDNHEAVMELYDTTVQEGYQILESDICM